MPVDATGVALDSRTIAALALSSEPELHHAKPKRSTQNRCRTNSRRGATDSAQSRDDSAIDRYSPAS